jgi:nitrate/nitrite-specific signal transduction histidine kinase
MSERLFGDESSRSPLPTSSEDLRKRNQSLAILYEIAPTVGQTLDLKTILEDALGKIINFMGVDSGAEIP